MSKAHVLHKMCQQQEAVIRGVNKFWQLTILEYLSNTNLLVCWFVFLLKGNLLKACFSMLWCNPLAAIQMDYLEIHPSKAPWMGIFRPEILSGERIWKPGLHPPHHTPCNAQWLLMDRNQAFLHSLCKMLFLDGLITKGVSLISFCHNVATEACTFSMEHKHWILCAVSSVLLLESGHPPFLKNSAVL